MKLAMIGLGRMGLGLAARLKAGGHQVLGFDLDPGAAARAAQAGVEVVRSMDAAVAALTPPRIVWVMLPAGQATGQTLATMGEKLDIGDILVDGGNSDSRDTMKRVIDMRVRGIAMIDCGTSGGLEGARHGYCLMAGGESDAVEVLTPLLDCMAGGGGAWKRVGTSGAGHYAKMVHNAVEYGMMQAIAEGAELLQAAPELSVSAARAMPLWKHGSVVRSWLLDLATDALKKDPSLRGFQGRVGQSGEGAWAFQTARAKGVPVPALEAALHARDQSAGRRGFADKLLSAMRQAFGGHRE